MWEGFSTSKRLKRGKKRKKKVRDIVTKSRQQIRFFSVVKMFKNVENSFVGSKDNDRKDNNNTTSKQLITFGTSSSSSSPGSASANNGPFETSHVAFFMKIKSVQFGLLSNEDVQKLAVCNITQSKIPTQSDVRCHGTVYDPRMGTTNPRLPCSTCRKNIWNCPGHFGMITLSRKIFHPLFSSHLVNVLRCFCITCHRPVVSQEDLSSGVVVFEELVQKLKRVKKNACPHCGCFQADFKATQSDLSSSCILFKFHNNTNSNFNPSNVFTKKSISTASKTKSSRQRSSKLSSSSEIPRKEKDISHGNNQRQQENKKGELAEEEEEEEGEDEEEEEQGRCNGGDDNTNKKKDNKCVAVLSDQDNLSGKKGVSNDPGSVRSRHVESGFSLSECDPPPPLPSSSGSDSAFRFSSESSLIAKKTWSHQGSTKVGWVPLFVEQIHEIVKKWSTEDLKAIGIDVENCHPLSTIITHFPVLPTCGRTFVVSSEMFVCDDDLTYQYSEIVKPNNTLATISHLKMLNTVKTESQHNDGDENLGRKKNQIKSSLTASFSKNQNVLDDNGTAKEENNELWGKGIGSERPTEVEDVSVGNRDFDEAHSTSSNSHTLKSHLKTKSLPLRSGAATCNNPASTFAVSFRPPTNLFPKLESNKLRGFSSRSPPTESALLFHERKAMCNLVFRTETALDNSNQRARHAISGKAIMGLKERMTGKKGIIRDNCVGKRTNQSGRSVIGPDPTLDLHQLGVPELMAKVLTFTEIVCPINKAVLQQAVDRDQCSFIIKASGKKINLKIAKQLNRTTVSGGCSIRLQNGDKVLRHLRDGDWVILNRQPTLHRGSMFGMEVKVLKNIRTLKINLALTESFNCDFDGDEKNIFPPQSYETKSEVMNLSSPLESLVSQQNGNPYVTIVQDSLLSAYLMSSERNFEKTMDWSLWSNLWFSVFQKRDHVFENDDVDISATIQRLRNSFALWTTSVVWDYIRYLFLIEDQETWERGVEIDGLLEIIDIDAHSENGSKTTSSRLSERLESDSGISPIHDNINLEKTINSARNSKTFFFKKEWLFCPHDRGWGKQRKPITAKQLQPNAQCRCKEKRPKLRFEPFSFLNGRGLLGIVFPPTFSTFSKEIAIFQGLVVHGRLTKKNLGRTKQSFIKNIFDEYGKTVCARFVNRLQRMTNEFVKFHGFTISPNDCRIPAEFESFNRLVTENAIETIKNDCSSALESIRNQDLLERYIINIVNRSTERLKIQTFNVLPPDNGLLRTCFSGSKGDTYNIMQIMCVLGQQYIDGSRISPTMTQNTRTSPYIPFVVDGGCSGGLSCRLPLGDRQPSPGRSVHHNNESDQKCEIETDLRSRGFISSNFISGLTPHDFFTHSCSGRMGIIDSSTSTSMSGYTYRQVAKTLEDVVMASDGTVIDLLGRVIMPYFGFLGCDPAKEFFGCIANVIQQIVDDDDDDDEDNDPSEDDDNDDDHPEKRKH